MPSRRKGLTKAGQRDNGFDLKAALDEEFRRVGFGWSVKGVLDSERRIYTLTNDTKLISKVFELLTTPIITRVAEAHGFNVILSDRQTVYPDITLDSKRGKVRLAVDVKSTYRRPGGSAGFTLGSYTAYLRNPTKNIMFPYGTYTAHWVVGFVYSRNPEALATVRPIDEFEDIEPAIEDIEVIIQEKWRIASERPGSGNTANIGSVTNLRILRDGTGPFVRYGQAVFLDYWRNFITQGEARKLGQEQPFRNIDEYLDWRKRHPSGRVHIPEDVADRLALAGEANDVPHE